MAENAKALPLYSVAGSLGSCLNAAADTQTLATDVVLTEVAQGATCTVPPACSDSVYT